MKKVIERMKREGLVNYKSLNIDNICVAVSGGVDSIVLLHFLSTNFPQSEISILHINHGLRKESVEEEAYVKSLGEQFKCKVFTTKVNVYDRMEISKLSMEMAARELRYEFFKTTMAEIGSKYLFLGHHADDLLETMVMREVNGSSSEGLISIRYLTDKEGYSVIRPLLPLDKKEVYAYAELHNLKFFEDESNKDESILRNRYRNSIIPLLKKENPNITKVYAQRSEQLAEDEDFFNELVEDFKSDFVKDFFHQGVVVSLDNFKSLKKPLQRRVLKSILKDLNPNKSYPINSLEQLEEKFNTENMSYYIPLFGDVIFVKGYNQFYLLIKELHEETMKQLLNKHILFEDYEVKKIQEVENFNYAGRPYTPNRFWNAYKIPKAFRENLLGVFEGNRLKAFPECQ